MKKNWNKRKPQSTEIPRTVQWSEKSVERVSAVYGRGRIGEASMKGTMDPEGSARNSRNSWPLYVCWADQRVWYGELLRLLHALVVYAN